MERANATRFGVLVTTGGFVDAAGFVTLFGVFTSHLTGDTTHLAAVLGAGHAGGALTARIVVLVTFVVAVVLGTALLALRSHPASRRALLGSEAALLAGVAGLGTWWHDHGGLTLGSGRVLVLTAAAGTAMGLHNVASRTVVGTTVNATYVTGTLIAVGEDLAACLRDARDPDAPRRLRRHGLTWTGFLVGGIAGAAAATAWHLVAFALPAVAVALLAVAAQPEGGS